MHKQKQHIQIIQCNAIEEIINHAGIHAQTKSQSLANKTNKKHTTRYHTNNSQNNTQKH